MVIKIHLAVGDWPVLKLLKTKSLEIHNFNGHAKDWPLWKGNH